MRSLLSLVSLTSISLWSGLSLTVLSAAAQGSDSGRLPPPPLPIPTSGAPAAAGGPVPAGAPAPGAATISTADLTVTPGAGEEQRKALLGRIMEAKNQGIGTSTYMMAFDALEQSAKGGESEANVLKRIDSLNTSLDDQFKRSVILKTQRAAPPVAASAPSAPYGGGTPPRNTDTAALIQKLKNKYGDQIPSGLQDKLPPGLRDQLGSDPSQLLKNPQVQDLINRYKN